MILQKDITRRLYEPITLHLISCIPITISLSQEIVFNFIATSNLSYAYLSKQKVVIWTGIAVFLDSHIIKTQNV